MFNGKSEENYADSISVATGINDLRKTFLKKPVKNKKYSFVGMVSARLNSRMKDLFPFSYIGLNYLLIQIEALGGRREHKTK